MSLSAMKALVAEHASIFDGAVTADGIHIYEDAHRDDDNTLVVQVAARRPADRTDWIRRRSRFSQTIRDALVAHGDERYPLIQIFEPEEWPARND